MKNKLLLTTVFTGYNYGSSLQAFASKMFLKSLGWDCEIVAIKSLVKGRNIQFNKLITIVYRTIVLNKASKGLAPYAKLYSKNIVGKTKQKFISFIKQYISPNYYSWYQLKKIAKSAKACVAGSDQIWSADALYVDPLYYLRFAPKDKRIALAPSFGLDYVPNYNKKKITKWIKDFSFLATREDAGVKIIKELTDREAKQLIDPTLLLDGESWCRILNIKPSNDDYILAYFLDPPSTLAIREMKHLAESLKCKVIAIPYIFDDMTYCENVLEAGPIEFLQLVKNARVVCTDSFHGTAFSINFHTPFFVFDRRYTTGSQSSRVKSVLKLMNMLGRFDPIDSHLNVDNLDFSESDRVLELEREKVREYINNALSTIS